MVHEVTLLAKQLLVGNGFLVPFSSPGKLLEDGCLLIEGNLIQDIGITRLLQKRYPQSEFIDAGGGLIMPGLINAHSHLYSSLARGMPFGFAPPSNFLQILERLWWRLDRALDGEGIYYSALAGLIAAVRCGTTTIIDHHASPSCATGSLEAIARALKEVGIRGCLSYEVSDRHGSQSVREGIEENLRHLDWCQEHGEGMISGSFGLHASLTLSDDTLGECRDSVSGKEVGFHLHLAEDRADVKDCHKKYGKTITSRLEEFGILGPKTIAAHCVQVTDKELDILGQTDTKIVHNPRSNMNNAVGAAPIARMWEKGLRPAIGTDGMGMNMILETYFAYLLHKHQSSDPRVLPPDQAVEMMVLNNSRVAGIFFAPKLGVIEVGNLADVIIISYDPPTEINTDNLFSHLILGLEDMRVTTTIVNGRVLMKEGRLLTVEEEKVRAEVKKVTARIWQKMREI
ncbi:hypothetical protein HKBW3S42_00400 [Candidatus Hakubella thermalkaliphila]|uniref:Amidohydrolase-related domain-containing protein n=1 Tax=Candidatus Hakubella thermalkaliphila TaxID=2754717 RepID=A0A6V8PHF3_9ACTN|nr:hypothetical protein HKBW3S42_00400 [Candidatus Hakubella thermalkaliphila]